MWLVSLLKPEFDEAKGLSVLTPALGHSGLAVCESLAPPSPSFSSGELINLRFFSWYLLSVPLCYRGPPGITTGLWEQVNLYMAFLQASAMGSQSCPLMYSSLENFTCSLPLSLQVTNQNL